MKYLLAHVILILGCFNLSAQSLIPAGVQSRVFNIRTPSNIGTCFLIDINHANYLVTAKHLFDSATMNGARMSVSISSDFGWQVASGTAHFHTSEDIDIAVFKLDKRQVKGNYFEISTNNITYSEECFFLGFPYNIKDVNVRSESIKYPIPFVKKAIVSNLSKPKESLIIYLDGHNNPGFSGGPVVVNHHAQNKNSWQVIGVVSGYRRHWNKVDIDKKNWDNFENSGIFMAYGSQYILEIIEQMN